MFEVYGVRIVDNNKCWTVFPSGQEEVPQDFNSYKEAKRFADDLLDHGISSEIEESDGYAE